MPRRFQLQNYSVHYDTTIKKICVSIAGDTKYHEILTKTFPNRCGSPFTDVDSTYDWGIQISGKYTEMKQVDDLLNMFTFAVCMDDDLNQSFALDYYYKPYWNDPEGGLTLAGSLVHQAKYYPAGTTEHEKQLTKLVAYFSRFISVHPAYKSSDYLIGVPFFGTKDFDLPTTIAKRLSENLGIMCGNEFVKKVRSTQEMKSLETKEEKQENIAGVFELDDNVNVTSKLITVIDDVYRSGTTIAEFSRILRNAGAVVQGLFATKTVRD